jgi:cardiolipin synthase
VAVRVLLDAFGARGMKEETREAMQAAGVRVSRFRPLRFGMLTRFYRRNHRRAIVIDGRVAFTGGMAVAPQWLGNAQDEEHWRDTMVAFSGPPATDVQSAFADAWAYSTGELLAGDAFFPAWPQLPMDAPSSAAVGPPAADGGPFIHTGLASAPSKEDHPLALLLLLTFNGARQRLWITTPYFIPDETMRRALVERAGQGVDVRLLLPGEKIDAAPVRLAAQRHYEELLRGGVRIFEYQPTMLHSKSIVVDGVWSVVGSANMNVRSRELDHENVVAVSNRAFARKLEDVFTQDLTRAREIRYQEWARRGRWQRLKERLCSAMAQVS